MKKDGVSRRWFIGGAATGVVYAGLELSGCSRAVPQEAEAAGNEPVAGELAHAVEKRSGGNPFFAEELLAAEVRATLDHLGQIVGAVYTDDILDRIFSRFCIGK